MMIGGGPVRCWVSPWTQPSGSCLIRRVQDDGSTGAPWTDREIDLIVADYFEMLRMELAGEPFVKSHRNAALRELISRSHKSVEFKHQNISAVLEKLGRPWITGYKPKRNFQKALVDGVERYIAQNPLSFEATEQALAVGFRERFELFFAPPPTVEERDDAPDFVQRLVRKFDPAARDARNRALGKQGEERILVFERSRLAAAGRDDLARKVCWVSEELGDGAGYDILSFDERGAERLLEVKTTTGHERTPFYLSENERLLSAERPKEFRLVRLYDFARTPRAFEMIPPLENSVLLRPTTYRASFQA